MNAYEMAGCPSDDVLAALSEGRLDERELAALHAHVDGCQSCQWLLAELAAAAEPAPAVDSPSTAPVVFAPGATLGGRYRLERRLGNGGMGTVWAALHVGTDRRVALKVLRRERGATGEARLRFLREARLLGRIEHPNLVEVRDVFEEGGVPILAMELLDGESLGERLRREGTLAIGELAPLFLGALEALDTAHQAGVVHRDLKPDNLFIDRQKRLRVLDFGVAKLIAPDDATVPALTAPGEVIGTPPYMAPEQLRAEPDIDRRTDVWAAGVILYECLAGRRPFVAGRLSGYVEAVCAGRREPLATVAPSVPREVAALVERMLTVDRAARPPSLREAIEVLRRHAAVEAAPARRRSWPLAAALGTIALALAAVGVVTLRRTTTTPAPVASEPARAPAPAPDPASPAPAAPTSGWECEQAWPPALAATLCRVPPLAMREAAWRADVGLRGERDARATLEPQLSACGTDETCLLERLRAATERTPVIDCRHAVSRDAQAICHDAGLASVAGTLAAYHQAILDRYRAEHRHLPRTVPPPRAYSTEQAASVIARHQCQDDQRCLARHLVQRLMRLKSLHSAFSAGP